MSLPGLGLEEPEEIHIVETTQHNLEKETEWRFEVPVGKYVQVKVRLSVLTTPLSSVIDHSVAIGRQCRIVRD